MALLLMPNLRQSTRLSIQKMDTSLTIYVCSPRSLQEKANGQMRICIDYRQLNRYTKRVQFP